MPIEVRQLVIRATVSDEASGKKSPQAGEGSQPPGAKKQDLVAECVDQVMEILREQQER